MAEFGAPELLTLTLEAAADLSAVQYHVVRHSAAQKCNVASDATNSGVLGILQTKPKSGEFGTVAVGGKSKAVAGAAITLPAVITHNSSGRVATVTSGQMAIGRALEAASADGDIITVLLFQPVRWAGAA
jgi:hypothetical protein